MALILYEKLTRYLTVTDGPTISIEAEISKPKMASCKN
jgi:hypothetical protein